MGAVSVTPVETAIVQSIAVQPNDRVVKGQVLARLYADDVAADLQSAQTMAARARSARQEASERLDAASKAADGQKRLSESGYASPAALQKALSEVNQRRAAVDQADLDVRAAELAADKAAVRLAQRTLVAPIDGVILSSTLVVGRQAGADPSKAAFELAPDMARVIVKAQVNEAEIGRIKPQMQVRISTDGAPDDRPVGRILQISPQAIGPRSAASFDVVIEVDSGGILKPGMNASVEFIRVDVSHVLRLPVEALYFRPSDYTPKLPATIEARMQRSGSASSPALYDGVEMGMLFSRGQSRLFVLGTDGKAHMRAVRIGAESDRFVEVREGVAAGELVVTSEVAR